jgi:hypothetical protein
MAMTIVEAPRGITGGVDTHLDIHVAAALDPLGRLIGSPSAPVSATSTPTSCATRSRPRRSTGA